MNEDDFIELKFLMRISTAQKIQDIQNIMNVHDDDLMVTFIDALTDKWKSMADDHIGRNNDDFQLNSDIDPELFPENSEVQGKTDEEILDELYEEDKKKGIR